MKKRFLILAAVAVSGVAAVVAGNTNALVRSDADARNCIEMNKNGVIIKGCIGDGGLCLFWTGSKTIQCTGIRFQ